MKAVILAGGFGTRISEESILKPKPMIGIGGMPILWHIMKYYSTFGINEFVICLGYKGYLIKKFFSNYYQYSSDITLNLQKNELVIGSSKTEPWTVHLVDTGENTMTGGRVKKIEKYIDETFCLTYGDGLSNVDVTKLIQFHKEQKKTVTLTAVQPPGRFGSLHLKDELVTKFAEKPKGDGSWINGGYFVCEPSLFDHIDNDSTIFEQATLPNLAQQNEVVAFKHHDFWQPMDTLREKNYLEQLWTDGRAPWKCW